MLQNSTADDRVISQLQPNGWGGPRCDVYFCDQPASMLFYSVLDPLTGKYYTNSKNQVLPGLWTGSACGAPIG